MNDLKDNELYRLIVESSNDGVWVIDKNEITILVNPKMAMLLECSIDDMVGKKLYDFMDEEGIAATNKRLEERKNGKNENHEFVLLKKTGERIWTEMKTSPIFINNEYFGALALVSDITERKKEELEKVQLLGHYYSLFEDSPIPIWDEDFSLVKIELEKLKQNGIREPRKYFQNNPDELIRIVAHMKVNSINQAVVELNEGASKEDVLNNFKKLLTKKSFEYALHQLVAIWNNQVVCEFDAELRTLKGNFRQVHFKWIVVKGYETTYEKVYLTTTDLTERIKEENLILQQSNREKATLLKEVHHRVKNNLQIISSLLKLQSYAIDDPKLSEIIEISLSRISSMAKVHELLYKSTEFSKIDFSVYIETLCESLISTLTDSNQKIETEISISDIQLNINTAIPLGLLINEILTNSLKHGFKEMSNGLISIKVRKLENDKYEMIIGDDGHGYFPVEGKKKESLGMSLIYSLSEQLNGFIEQITDKPGTHYRMEFEESI